MAIPSGVYRVTFGGSLPGGEVWESGFWVQGALPSTAAAANALALLWYGQITASDSSGALRIQFAATCSPAVVMRQVRVYAYPTGGPTAAIVGSSSGTPLAGSLSAGTMPNQCAIVVSLRTDLAGRRHRGRMFIPTDAAALSSGQLNSGVTDNIAAAWATCFSDWNASGDNGKVVCVSTVGGTATPLRGVLVDTRLDIQRRRANKQAALHTASGVITA